MKLTNTCGCSVTKEGGVIVEFTTCDTCEELIAKGDRDAVRDICHIC